MSVLSVLLVDDEPALLDLTRIYLQKDGMMTFEVCESARDALEKTKTCSFDAIVSDYEMPGMDGIMLLRHLRSRGDTTSFIIFTGRGREEVVIEALKCGADFYLQKGGDPRAKFAELRDMIYRAVRRRKAEQALIERERRYRSPREDQENCVAQSVP